MASKINPKSLMTVMTMTVMTTLIVFSCFVLWIGKNAFKPKNAIK